MNATKVTESVWIELHIHSQRYLIRSIYRLPDKYDFYDKLKIILDSIWIKCKDIILMGDLNSDLLFRGKINEQVYYGKCLLKILNPFGMKNVIKSATRITEDTATTIDLIIVSDTSKILNSGTFDLAISDHKLVFATLKLRRYNLRSVLREVRDYKNLDKTEFQRSFERVPSWVASIFDEIDDVTYCFQTFYNDIIKAQVKTKKATVKTKSLPWVNGDVHKIMNKRYRALLNWQKDKSNCALKRKYQNLRNQTRKELRIAETNYWISLRKPT